MNNRGQAALEYLMTYGWALIVIAIVVGVLVFIVSNPAGNVVCSSSDPAKVNTKASQINNAPATAGQTDFGTIILTNLTGGSMSNVDLNSATGAFAQNTSSTLGLETSYSSGVEITLKPDEVTTATANTYQTSTLVINYKDYASLSRTVTITCSGPITTK
ncbi:MAG: hypothetical protein Q8N60_05410 [Candidatus Diapherotrites archaeon]|nr:hypothetical protein [Candidatus Diapherotrites archaeon]